MTNIDVACPHGLPPAYCSACCSATAERRGYLLPPDLKDRVAALERLAPNVPPVFHQLFAYLPKPGEGFSRRDRLAFLKAAAALCDVVYGPEPLNIEIKENLECP